MVKDKYKVYNILDLSDGTKEEERDLAEMLSSFSCTKNAEVSEFLKKNALVFAHKKQAITYLVFSKETGMLVGYFALTIKPITFVQKSFDSFSKTLRKKIERNARYDKNTDSYALGAYLIAQFGKDDKLNAITGKELMEITISKIQEIQTLIGGNIAFVEAEPEPKLLEFYEKQGLFQFAITEPQNNQDIKQLVQLMLIL